MTGRDRVTASLQAAIPGIIACACWELAAHLVPDGRFRFASPTAVLSVAIQDMVHLNMYRQICVTLSETVGGLVVGSVVGTAVGLLLWMNHAVARAFRPYITLAGTLPVFAVAPILINLFGTGFSSKLFIVSFSTVFVAIAQAYEGALSADSGLVLFAQALKAPRSLIAQKIAFPSALAWVSGGIRINIGFALIAAFLAEYIVTEESSTGLGRYIARNAGLYDMPRVLLGVLLLAAIGLGLTELFGRVLRRFNVRRQVEGA
jgi:NitT/TauT family transport system permease protein